MTDQERRERFSTLLAGHQSQILGYILALVMNRSDAEDLFQASALVMWNKFDEFDASTSFLSWGCRIAYYEASNFLRKKRPISTPEFTALMDAFAAEADTDDSEDTRQTALVECIDKLKSTDRSVIDLVYANDLSVADAAIKLDRSPSGVANTLLRIRRALLACVQHAMRREGR